MPSRLSSRGASGLAATSGAEAPRVVDGNELRHRSLSQVAVGAGGGRGAVPGGGRRGGGAGAADPAANTSGQVRLERGVGEDPLGRVARQGPRRRTRGSAAEPDVDERRRRPSSSASASAARSRVRTPETALRAEHLVDGDAVADVVLLVREHAAAVRLLLVEPVDHGPARRPSPPHPRASAPPAARSRRPRRRRPHGRAATARRSSRSG